MAKRLTCLIALALFFRGGLAVSQEAFLYVRHRTGITLRTEQGEERVAYCQGPHVAPRLSPDGRRVLFNSYEGGEMGAWLVGIDGGDKQRVCDGMQAAWSPDGAKALIQREGRILERDLASGAESFVSPEGAPSLAYPAYSPHGILCVDKAGTRVYRVERDALETLVEAEVLSAPRCSPDGQILAYQDGAHIHLMDLDSRRFRQLTAAPGVQAHPVWGVAGRGLCYAQSHSPQAEKWAIRFVDVDNPNEISTIERKVYPAFDWNGQRPEPAGTHTIPGKRLTVWRGDRPLRLRKGQGVGSQRGWKRLPRTETSTPVKACVAIENDWLVLCVSPQGISLIPKGENPVALGLARDDGSFKTEEIRLGAFDGESAAVTVCDPIAAETVFRVRRTRPVVEVHTTPPDLRLTLEAGMEALISPDRFANDLLLTRDCAPPNLPAPLPRTPVVVGCLSGGAMLMAVAPSETQCFEVADGADGRPLNTIAIRPSGRCVFLAVLAGKPYWNHLNVARNEDGAWQAEWQEPFVAQWRMAVRGQGKAYSRMWGMDDLSRLGREPVPIEEPFAHAPVAAVMYAWDRDPITPPDVLTPSDILLDTLGIESHAAAIDIEGIRAYRSADEWVPFPELATRDIGWRPTLAHQETRPFGVLDIMNAAFAAGTPGTRSFLTHLGNDAGNLLRGLDARIAEYERFLEELAAFGQERDHKFLASTRARAREVLEAGRAAPKTDVAVTAKALEAVLNMLGPPDGSYDAGDMIGKKDEFLEFSRLCRKILSERQAVLSGYRTLAKQVRDGGALAIIADPASRDEAEALREMARGVLRHRYYLEGDWRGESPLAPLWHGGA